MKVPAMNNDIPRKPTQERNLPAQGEEQAKQKQNSSEDQK